MKKKKKLKKKKKKTILEKKAKRKIKKKHVGKVKAEFSTSSILKKNSIKIILEKKHVEKHFSKTKTMWGNIVTVHSVLKKNYEIKSTKTILKKKRRFIKKIKKGM